MAESLATLAAVTLVAIDCHHVLIEPPFRGRGGNAAEWPTVPKMRMPIARPWRGMRISRSRNPWH
jgi:hypothetical protein